MDNGQRPAYPVVYEHDDATSEQPGLTKEEYARIELAKAMMAEGHCFTDSKLHDIDHRARYLASLLLED